MTTRNFLYIEENPQDAAIFEDAIELMNHNAAEGDKISITIAKNLTEARKYDLDNFTGIIADLTLNNNEENGFDFVKEVMTDKRIPTVIFTGTPSNSNGDPSYGIKEFIKSEAKPEQIIEYLDDILSTGILNVLGRTGKLEAFIQEIFWHHLNPRLEHWIEAQREEAKSSDSNMEHILLRYVSALIQNTGETNNTYLSEEFYIRPLSTQKDTFLKTGEIVSDKAHKYYIILSPPCDLVMHNGQTKTTDIMLCAIESAEDYLPKKATRKGELSNKQRKQDKKEMKKVITNNIDTYHHWLPEYPNIFVGGLINFRKITTVSLTEFTNSYDQENIQVQPIFTKNILSRFSTYYARQGQPDLHFEGISDIILDKLYQESLEEE